MEEKFKNKKIYDPIYGFVEITDLEWEIIHSPFYQRLRWIKQLGFSCYVFPGAEHSRFGHSIGVMHNAHKIIESCGKGVEFYELQNHSSPSPEAQLHKNIRIAALLHDLGTFPFSHTIENSYIRHGVVKNKNKHTHADDHENLGSFIIKNTSYEGGITDILERHNVEPKAISDLMKGKSHSVFANQILHSEVDCDRMDYLLRDAHYTGLNYGTYDRDYLLHHFSTARVGKQDILVIKHNALQCVEDFLLARFAWYSQVIRSSRGAKFDALAEELALILLQHNKIYQYEDLMEMVVKRPTDFYQFNDSYFLSSVKKALEDSSLHGQKIKDLANSLLFELSPFSLKIEEFSHTILNQDDEKGDKKARQRVHKVVDKIEDILKTKGGSKDWIISDIPTKKIVLVKSYLNVLKDNTRENLLLNADPVKILDERGEVRLLAEIEHSLMSRLQNVYNFTPNIFCSASAQRLLLQEKVIENEDK